MKPFPRVQRTLRRVHAGYAQPGLVKALRLLLEAALADPRNTKFVLVSEACVPLWHPVLIWTQLNAEGDYSRVENKTSLAAGYFDPKMTTELFTQEHWKKSAQWVALSRLHADLVARDEHVWPRVEEFCTTPVRAIP